MGDSYQIFEVPVIPADLRQEDALYQIADSLDYLAKVTDTVFDCINSRIYRNKERIDNLDRRILTAKSKVEKLKGIKRATQIFSTSKYPAGDAPEDYLSIFDNMPKCPYISETTNKSEKYTSLAEEPILAEKLQFFHVKGSLSNYHKKNNCPGTVSQTGLGKMPENIECVSSLLLFNTFENLYERYTNLDPMGSITKVRKVMTEDLPHPMEAPPLSISNKESLDEQVKENYFYLPSLGDVPKIDAPLDLPDLPGIADDLRYSVDLDPGFAPSVAATPAVSDLPSLPDESLNQLPGDTTSPQLIESQISSLPLSPPDFNQLLSSPPPPPPPPPPPLLPVLNPEKELKINSQIPSASPAIIEVTNNDARANLMAAIRNAGGKLKLKPIQSGRDESKRIQEEKKLIGKGGDLMADLHSKLLLRRKGISGEIKKDLDSVISGMDKVSAMIPPPVPNELSSATEDDEWEE